jgi:hypothetical protein
MATWAALIISAAAMVAVVSLRVVAALTFHLFRYRFQPHAFDGIRCVLCRCCMVTGERRRGRSKRSQRPSAQNTGGAGGTPASGNGCVCGGRWAAVTCCERLQWAAFDGYRGAGEDGDDGGVRRS